MGCKVRLDGGRCRAAKWHAIATRSGHADRQVYASTGACGVHSVPAQPRTHRLCRKTWWWARQRPCAFSVPCPCAGHAFDRCYPRDSPGSQALSDDAMPARAGERGALRVQRASVSNNPRHVCARAVHPPATALVTHHSPVCGCLDLHRNGWCRLRGRLTPGAALEAQVTNCRSRTIGERNCPRRLPGRGTAALCPMR